MSENAPEPPPAPETEPEDIPPPADEGGSGPLVEEGAPSWTVTFGDMMSLLLTFFILLFSMSEIKMERFLLASQSLREAIGGTAETPIDDPMGLMPDPVDPDLQLSAPGMSEGATISGATDGDGPDHLDLFSEAYMKMIAQRLDELVEDQGLEELLDVEITEDGVYLRMQSTALFGSGEASIRQESSEMIGKLSEITRELNIPTVVSGHADNQPISTAAFPSNWELSAARAAGVARFLVQSGQDPESVQVKSFGSYAPVADNATAEGRAKNRRVELFFSRVDIRAAAMQLQRQGEAQGI